MEWLLAIFGIYCLYLGVKEFKKKDTKKKAIRSLEDELSNLKEWCYKQNMIDENSYYWIEKKEEDKIKNVVDKLSLIHI